MKTKNICKTAALLMGLTGFSACNEAPKPKDYLIVHFVDDTSYDEFQHPVEKEDILSLVHLDEQPTNGVKYRVIPINDLTLNESFYVHLPMETKTLYNSLERDDQIKEFKYDLDIFLGTIYDNEDTVFNATNLFIPLISNLEAHKNDTREIIFLLQSDMIENSSLFSLDQTFKKGESTERVLEDVISQNPLPDLTNITIIILFQPSAHNNAQFNYAVDFFKPLFEKQGAIVKVQASL